jgi:hypothetical protein
MIDDLVKRLRNDWTPIYGGCVGTMFEAADRIEKLEAALRKIKDLHDQPGPEDEQVIIIRDDMAYFIVCEALEETP